MSNDIECHLCGAYFGDDEEHQCRASDVARKTTESHESLEEQLEAVRAEAKELREQVDGLMIVVESLVNWSGDMGAHLAEDHVDAERRADMPTVRRWFADVAKKGAGS